MSLSKKSSKRPGTDSEGAQRGKRPRQSKEFSQNCRNGSGGVRGPLSAHEELEGHHKYTYDNGSVYEGQFKDGKREGRGKCTWVTVSNGTFNSVAWYDVYEGEWKADKREGFGTHTQHFRNVTYVYGGQTFCHVYEGQWKANQREGHGKMTFGKGHQRRYDRYKMFTYANGFEYSAEWKAERASEEERAKGNVYEGEWKADKIEGEGKKTFASGDVYEGEFKDGKFLSGHGKETSYNGHSVYEGQWNDGKHDGHGKETLGFKGMLSVYEGEWRRGQYYHGTKTWPDGSSFEGNWKNDGKFKGKQTFENGDVYDGHWNRNKREGYGKQTFKASGDVYEGEWKADKMDGEGKKTFANGDVYEGKFKDGKQVS